MHALDSLRQNKLPSSYVRMNINSWGRYPQYTQTPIPITTRNIHFSNDYPSFLPYGLGRSYGDSCLNQDGAVLLTRSLDNFISFSPAKAEIEVESGVSLEELNRFLMPQGFFIPVSPGTQFVTVGGAIANDIHGKNHHVGGSFGNHISSITLLKSSGEVLEISPSAHRELFSATIGGLGLTGLILKASFKLKKIDNPYVDQEIIPFVGLDDFFSLSKDSREYEFTVSWVDCLSKTPRGLFMRGNFNTSRGEQRSQQKTPLRVPFPFEAPSFLLNSLTIRAFNEVYFRRIKSSGIKNTIYYIPFFYPLDAVHEWNKMYGPSGFFQWQCVVPAEGDFIQRIFKTISNSGEGSFLAVLKTFGDIKPVGMLSFPREGVTLALDFQNKGTKTLNLLNALDEIVHEARGGLYAAKDARMSKEMFTLSYPRIDEFRQFKDPKFSSSLWRRVT